MVQVSLMTVGFLGAFLSLVGCRGAADESDRATAAQSEAIVPNLPSISELAGTPTVEVLPLPTLSPDEIAIGREIYAGHCAECHGEHLQGEAEWQRQNDDNSFRAPPHDVDGHTWHHGDQVLIESIVLGGERLPDNIGGFSDMPAFGDELADEEISAVLTYIKSSWPEEIRSLQWEQTVREQNR